MSDHTKPIGHCYHRVVQFHEVDMVGIVHFSNLLRFMEEAEHACWRSLGYSVYDAGESETMSWPRVSVKCDFKNPARFEDVLDIYVAVKKLGSKSLTWSMRAYVKSKEIAEAEFTVVCCLIHDSEPMKSISIPAAVRAKLETLLLDKGKEA